MIARLIRNGWFDSGKRSTKLENVKAGLCFLYLSVYYGYAIWSLCK